MEFDIVLIYELLRVLRAQKLAEWLRGDPGRLTNSTGYHLELLAEEGFAKGIKLHIVDGPYFAIATKEDLPRLTSKGHDFLALLEKYQPDPMVLIPKIGSMGFAPCFGAIKAMLPTFEQLHQ